MLSRPPSPTSYERRLALVLAILFSLLAWGTVIVAVLRLT